jgi:hypothetical protein
MMEIRNAIIKSARITTADYGLLTVWVELDYGDSCQGFGGYGLFRPESPSFANANYAGLFVWRVMEVAGVDDWDKLTGKTIRVRAEHSKVHSIGHIVKDIWFDPEAEINRMKRKQEDDTNGR